MAIRTVVTRGFGNGTFDGAIALLVTRGYIAGAAVVPAPAPAAEAPAVAAPGWVAPAVQQTFIERTEIVFPQWWVSVREEFLSQETKEFSWPVFSFEMQEQYRETDHSRVQPVLFMRSMGVALFDRASYKVRSDIAFVDIAAIKQARRTQILRDLGVL